MVKARPGFIKSLAFRFPIYWKIELFEMMIVQCERMRFLGTEGIVSFYPHEQKMNEF